MNVFKHNQLLIITLLCGMQGMAFVASAEEESSFVTARSGVARPATVSAPVRPKPPVQRHQDKGLGKLLGKTIKTAVSQKKKKQQRPVPLYKHNGEVKNDLATRLTDPQRKESPIRTARLFKIQIQEEPVTVPVATKVEVAGSTAK